MLIEFSPERIKEIELQIRQQFLFELCQKFIQEYQICVPESVWQNEDVIQNSLCFIEEICQIVGYHKHS